MRSQSSYDSFWNTAKRGFMRMPVFIRSVIAISVAVFVLQAIGGSLFNQWFVSFFWVPTGTYDRSHATMEMVHIHVYPCERVSYPL